LRQIDPTTSTAIAPSTEGRKLMLVFEHRMVDLVADRVGSRFKQLARLVGRSGSIVRR
jgi:exopolyphosphatase / guanosine-5'-triphosphate,3'-diphosphate pyrophosphatase